MTHPFLSLFLSLFQKPIKNYLNVQDIFDIGTIFYSWMLIFYPSPPFPSTPSPPSPSLLVQKIYFSHCPKSEFRRSRKKRGDEVARLNSIQKMMTGLVNLLTQLIEIKNKGGRQQTWELPIFYVNRVDFRFLKKNILYVELQLNCEKTVRNSILT